METFDNTDYQNTENCSPSRDYKSIYEEMTSDPTCVGRAIFAQIPIAYLHGTQIPGQYTDRSFRRVKKLYNSGNEINEPVVLCAVEDKPGSITLLYSGWTY